ncbi:hypothetical protein UlMin_008265 [Ulmus minor]
MNRTEHLCLSLLNKCKTVKIVKQIHAFVVKTGFETNPLVAGKLLLHCSVTISDALDYARRLLVQIRNPDAFMYNSLIRGFAQSENPEEAFVTFKEMYRKAMDIDSFSFAFILKASANLRCFRSGIQLHCRVLVHGFDGHVFVGTTLVSMYGECGCLEFARKVFEEMPEPNVVAWNAILTACFRGGDVSGAEGLFERMPIWNSTSWNVMLDGYLKAGEVELAKKAFLRMPVKDDVSWSSMIVGFAHNGCFGDAFETFREMHRVGLKPNEASLTGILSASAQAGALEFSKILHCFVDKAGFLSMISVNNALIDAYSRCGNVGMARIVFETIPEKKSIVSWTSMIAALAMHGYGEEAIRIFHEMEEFGIRPDGITFISILYACSHAGLIEEGCRYFSKMIDYGIEPTIEHYGCMVDLYSRAGKLQKAYEFACKMPTPPNAIIWRILLGACSVHGNVQMAEQVKEKLSGLDPNNCGDHVLLSNIYATAKKWKDVVAVRRSMSQQRIQKNPGWSMIEVDKLIYHFVSNEKQNEITKEAYAKLREIMLKLRTEGGYIPEVGCVLYDIEEEEKENSVTRHSEKLAVAFGMARLHGGGTAIRIVKNLRICSDCHVVMKLISKVYGLEIVLRDRSRFHSFKDGSCSCKDYW